MGHAVPRDYNTRHGDSRARSSSRARPRGGVGPHGAAKYDYDPDNPSATKFPPYYDDAVFFGEFTRDYLREIRLDADGKVFKINNAAQLRRRSARRAQPFECDNPMDMQFGADGNFYLLTYGDGFFAANPDAGMYRWEYVKGQRAPQAVLERDADRRPGAADGAVLERGLARPGPGDSIRFAWDFDGDGTVDSTDPNPSYTYTANGVYTAKLTVTDSSGKTDTKTTDDHGRQHGADGRRSTRRSTATSSTGARHPVHGHGHRPRGRADRLLAGRGHVRARARHARPRRGQRERLLRHAADGRGGRVARRLHRRRHQRHLHGPRAPTASPR